MAKTKKAVTKTTRKSSAGTKKSPAASKKGKVATSSSESAETATINRRMSKDRRASPDRRKKSEPVKVERRKIERRAKVSRRRQIDPTTCERDYTGDEIEFMNALQEYKRSSGRMFPTCSEVLEVIKKLGYQKRPEQQPAEQPAAEIEADSVEQPPQPAEEQLQPLISGEPAEASF